MPALTPGAKAPSFQLSSKDGATYSLSGLKPGEKALVVFFKATCPTCMLAMPFIDKLFRHHQNDTSVRIVSIAQESAGAADQFAQTYKLSLPMALDQDPYRVSREFQITNVPTAFLVDANGTIEQTTIGFHKREYEMLASKLAGVAKKAAARLFDGIAVPEFKPG